MKKQRIGVIGLGPIGTKHAGIYDQMTHGDLVAVCDIIKERADTAAARFGVPGFYSVQDMVNTVELDMVSVATGGEEYGSDHYQPTIEAIAAGLHVLGEKPISNEIPQAEEMVAAAREKGVCYGIDLNHRFTPAARLAKRWVEEGKIGHQLFINVNIQKPRFKMKRERRLIPQRLLKGISGQVSGQIFFRAESPKGISITFVNGCSGKAKEECIRQCIAHLASQVAFLSSMRLINQCDNVLPVVQKTIRLRKFMHGRNDNLARVLP